MSWMEQEVRNLSHFMSLIGGLNAHWPNRERWLFRGQADASWGLEPTLLRLLRGAPTTNTTQVEDEIRHAFRAESGRVIDSQYIPKADKDLLGWWTLMRHYGAPTRLLDWSLSAYVALYFAVVDKWDLPGTVWCVRSAAVTHVRMSMRANDYVDTDVTNLKRFHDRIRTNTPTGVCLFFELKFQFDRLAAQQGWFSVADDPSVDHAVALQKDLAPEIAGALMHRFTIPAALKPHLLRELHMMNITAKSLFPGADGLGRSIEEIARLSIKFGRPSPPTNGRIEGGAVT